MHITFSLKSFRFCSFFGVTLLWTALCTKAPVQIDHSDSFREGCAVTSITVNADPRDWRNALACVVQEIRAICDYGITESEMKRYMDAMLKDVQKGVQENDTVPSEDHLNFIMTSDVFDHIVMHPEQSYGAFKEVAPTVTMEQVHATAKWMLGFIGYYGLAAAPPITAMVVCTPTQVYEEHSGKWVPFSITEQEIIELLLSVPDKTKEEALNQVDVPENLLSSEKLEKLLPPSPIDAMTAWRAASRKVDDVTGIVQIMLPNGARVNYACTPNESQGTMRILVPGGRSSDEPDELGSAMVGIRTISESGAVSDFSREQIELFAVSNLMSVHLDLNLEFSYIDANFTNTTGGLNAVLELLHLLFQEPRWEVPAFVRAQQAYKAQAYAVQKSLEQSTMDRLMRMMYADPRVSEALVEDLNKLTLAKVRRAVSGQLRPQDLEINLVADFEGRGHSKMQGVEGGLSTGKHREEGEHDVEEVELPEAAKQRRFLELDEALWKYLGLLPASQTEQVKLDRPPQINKGEELSPEDRQRTAHLEVRCGCPCHKLPGVKACDTDRTVTNERLRTSVVVHQTDGARETSTIRRSWRRNSSPGRLLILSSKIIRSTRQLASWPCERSSTRACFQRFETHWAYHMIAASICRCLTDWRLDGTVAQ
eukprot:symbB.v1.2.012142.t1/scaffold829.1/size159244/12